MKTKLVFLISILMICLSHGVSAQDVVYETFKDRRVINSHSVELLPARKLDFRVGHRFGDMLGTTGGWPTFYGLENSTDISTGIDYGVTDAINIGFSRTKGANELRQNLHGFFKAKLMEQQVRGNNPLSITFLGMTSISTMKKSQSVGILSSFPKFSHRLSHHLQIMIARKIGNNFSIQGNASWTYRNLVYNFDKNDLVSLGFCSRMKFSRAYAFIIDGNFPISNLRTSENKYYPAIGLGLEIDTGGGHVFQINVTNATGMAETDYIPYTQSNWSQGEFRLGFTISRIFNK